MSTQLEHLLKNKKRSMKAFAKMRQEKQKRHLGYKEIRLDNHASAPCLKAANTALIEALSLEKNKTELSASDSFVDGLSPHAYSQKALRDIEASKKAIKKALGLLDPAETSNLEQVSENLEDKEGLYDRVILTSSGAEAICQVHFSTYMEETRLTGKNHILILEGSPAVFCRSLERLEPLGVVTKYIKTGISGLSIDSFLEAISHRTALVSICTADSLVGSLEPIEEIARICRAKHIPLHIDITASLGKQWLDFEALNADMITFCGKPLGNPFPSGLLIVKQGFPCAPLIIGDMSQEGLRAGGISAPLFESAKIVLHSAIEHQNHMAMEIASLKKRLLDELTKNERFISFSPDMALPHVLCFGFSGIKGELLAYALSKRGVFVSIGGGAFPSLSRLLEAKGIDPVEAATALSIALTAETTLEDAKYAVQVLLEEVERLSSLFSHSPYKEEGHKL